MRHLIEPTNLSTKEIDDLMNLATDIINHKEKYNEVCKGKKLATLFYEPSTRTRLSFTAAMMELGGNVLGFSDAASSSVSKGETVADTVRVISQFADIIAMHPEIIIFDEPTAALDPVNADMLEEVLEKMAQEGKTIMISTHDVDFAYRWAERIVVFCDGKIIADDTPLAVFQNKEIVYQANLKRPMMLDIYEAMKEKGLVKENRSYPKNVEEFIYCI